MRRSLRRTTKRKEPSPVRDATFRSWHLRPALNSKTAYGWWPTERGSREGGARHSAECSLSTWGEVANPETTGATANRCSQVKYTQTCTYMGVGVPPSLRTCFAPWCNGIFKCVPHQYISMRPTHGDYDITDVMGYTTLVRTLYEIDNSDTKAERIDKVADVLLNGHDGCAGYITFGNRKLHKSIGIFNMNSATDCPNADSSEDNPTDTGVCQVPWGDCYAHVTENTYETALNKRRLQEFFWNSIDVETFADALLRVKERKQAPFDYLRVSQSGDFRHSGDITRWDSIAERVAPEITVYTYSASHLLDWSDAEHFTVNDSNGISNFGDRRYLAIESTDDIPDGAMLCPYDAAKQNGVDTENRPKCGECTACIEPEKDQPRDVAITIH